MCEVCGRQQDFCKCTATSPTKAKDDYITALLDALEHALECSGQITVEDRTYAAGYRVEPCPQCEAGRKLLEAK